MTAYGDDLILLTWKSGTGFVFNSASLLPKDTFSYEGDGWGLASTTNSLLVSDGTSYIRVLDPVTFEERSKFQVTDQGEPVDKLNELEWVEGELYANVWKTDRVAKINPITGEVTGWLDLSGLFTKRNPKFKGEDVLNGIAYDKVTKRLFVTGKLWPDIFEIKIIE